MFSLWAFVLPQSAQAQTIIRDSEIEAILDEMSEPILRAAALNPAQVEIIIVQDQRLNAFVAGGQNIFLNTGLIVETENVGELLGVIAHEAGHISGGHITRIRSAQETASTQAILGAILGAAVAVGTGDGSAGIGVAAGGSEAGLRSILKNSRTFEASADQAAIQFMERAGYSAKGLETFMTKLAKQELLPTSQQAEYLRTHPLSYERVQTIKRTAQKASSYEADFPSLLNSQYQRIKAKIIGYISPEYALQIFNGQKTLYAQYALAIASYRRGDIDRALQQVDTLIAQEPNNGYFYELKGQMLFENGRINDAITAYRSANNKAPNQALIQMAYAHALLERQDNGLLDEAIRNLVLAEPHERRTPRLHRLLARAYGRSGKDGLAKLHLAEEALLKNDKSLAIQQAKLALKALPKDSTSARQKAQDIIRDIENRKD